MVAEYGGLQSTDEGGVKYLLTDWQGSTRAVLGNTGAVQGRSDYTAYGEEISADIGPRTAEQGFGAANSPRQKYGLTERDDATGMDHTWFRKHENRAGRWTGADPYGGSMSISDPQSFNRFTYVSNEPTNFVDPSGLSVVVFFYPTNCRPNPYYDHVPGESPYICDQGVHIIYVGDDAGGGIEPGGVGPTAPSTDNSDDCPLTIWGVPDPSCLLRKALEAQKKKESCLKAAQERLRDAVHNLWDQHITDGDEFNDSLYVRAIIGALLAGRTNGGAGALFAGLGGAMTTAVPAMLKENRIFRGIQKKYFEELKSCGYGTNEVIPELVQI